MGFCGDGNTVHRKNRSKEHPRLILDLVPLCLHFSGRPEHRSPTSLEQKPEAVWQRKHELKTEYAAGKS